MAIFHFQCPECGFGDFEVGHLTGDHDIYCLVCLEEEQGRAVRLHRWEDEGEPVQARLRDFLEAA